MRDPFLITITRQAGCLMDPRCKRNDLLDGEGRIERRNSCFLFVERRNETLTRHMKGKRGPREGDVAPKRNRPILAKKAYYVCRPFDLGAASLPACDEIFMVRGDIPMRNRTETLSHESFPDPTARGPIARAIKDRKSEKK